MALDEIDEFDDYPKLPPKFEGVLKVLSMEEIDLDEAGQSLGVKFEVLESDNAEAPAGSKRFYLITGLNHQTQRIRKLKQKNVRKFLAPLFKRDVTDESQKWGAVYDLCIQKGAGNGRKIRCRTDAPKMSQKGNEWIEHHFSIAE